MVIFHTRALAIIGEHRSHRTAGEKTPGVGGGIVNLAILTALPATPASADDERFTVGKSSGRLVATRDLHIWTGDPAVRVNVIDTCSRRIGATSTSS